MAKYVTRLKANKPKMHWDEDHVVVTNITVYEQEESTCATGLFDNDGNELHRVTKYPLGFIWR